jgi:hypothetical protein
LHRARLTGLGHELDVGEGTAGDQQRVAIFECFLRRQGTEETNGVGGVGAVVGNNGFSEKGFYDRRTEQFGDSLEFVTCAKGTAASEDCDLLARIQNLR